MKGDTDYLVLARCHAEFVEERDGMVGFAPIFRSNGAALAWAILHPNVDGSTPDVVPLKIAR
jgi:hypothetical protein